MEREALAEVKRARRERSARRRAWRRATIRRLVPHRKVRRTGRLFARRTRSQRAAIATGVLVALVLVWSLVDSLSTRIGLTAFVAMATPALVVLTLDRRI
jgi:hypothetical protein